jgi:hypothetical protein
VEEAPLPQARSTTFRRAPFSVFTAVIYCQLDMLLLRVFQEKDKSSVSWHERGAPIRLMTDKEGVFSLRLVGEMEEGISHIFIHAVLESVSLIGSFNLSSRTCVHA